nr:tRNA 2-selenouridine(34) synthase MnmH [Hydrogenophaga sp.]
VIEKPKDWKPLVYCWRGGNRSGALATILGAIGFRVTLIEGGYKAWRAALVDNLPQRAEALRYRVICGPTGSGKTRLLSSVLGHLPGQPQPSQKRFDSLVWQALRQMDPTRLVYVESESKKVGNLRVPDALMDCMRASECVDLQLSDEERVALLLEDYAHFSSDNTLFCQRLEALTELRGKAVVAEWCRKVMEGRTPDVVLELLNTHYDPMYKQSIAKNFVRFPRALSIQLKNRQADALAAAAREIVRSETQA